MAKQDLDINIQNVTRVEGHGNIVVNVKNGKLEKCDLEITESPRLFEAMLVGRPWQDAVHITSRICGICSAGHTNASLRGMENAIGVTPSEQTVLLRRLMLHGEHLQSHYLHVFFLAVPDFLGVGSVIPLAGTHPDVVKMALRLKRLGNDICGAVGGRHINPIALRVGGFTKLPAEDELAQLRERLQASLADAATTIEVVTTLKLPDFERDMEFVAIHEPGAYPIYKGTSLKGTKAGEVDEQDYRKLINEYVVGHSHAKHCKTDHASYLVGSLARFNINYEGLRTESKGAAAAMGLEPGCTNSFMNNVAQVVECVEFTLDAIDLIDTLLKKGIDYDDVVTAKADAVPWQPGQGAAAVEVPRGTLIHDYTVGEDGRITAANLIIPTNMNLNNIEADMRKLVPEILDRPQPEIAHSLEMLVRAYDPCISCATHLLKVDFV